ncbi:MAG: T9SS type A sorting domain-containing protein [Janthinobacterium lividum]
MTTIYSRARSWGRQLRRLGLAGLLLSSAASAQAQTLTYTSTSASNVAGIYTDLGTSGTAIATANTDDANSAAQNIGFTFGFNGSTFTQFVFNTNGVIRLGSAAPSTVALYYDYAGSGLDPLASTNAANTNLLMPFNFDLVPGTGQVDYRVLTSGTAPNRVCTIQWRNVADKPGTGRDVANTTQYANFSFQLKLYETTNAIEFVYGQATAGTGAAGIRFPNVGLKGSGLSDGQLLLGLKGVNAAWSSTTFQNTNYTTSAHNITKSVGPDAGRTYRFEQALATDVKATAIYTLGEIATPTSLPQSVQAVVTNTGYQALTNVAVALSVTGANTFSDTQTVASLAPGASTTVTFAAYPATLTTGTNNLTVTVTAAGDGNAANNTATYTQLVTPDRLSYINPGDNQFYYSDVDSAAAGGVQAVKFTVARATTLTNATLLIRSLASNVTQPITYKVVVYDATGSGGIPGNVLYTSPNQTRTAAGGAATVSLGGIQVPAGSFYIGMQETSTGGSGLLLQVEDPARPNTFFLSFAGGAPWYDLSQYDVPYRYAIEVQLGAAATCDPPTAVSVTATTTNSATVAFTAATGNTGYQLVYGPAGFNPNAGGTTVNATTSPVTLTGLSSATAYDVYVRSNCTSGGTSLLTPVVSFVTACDPTAAITAFPYTQNFDTLLPGQALPCGITILDANTDGATWAITKTTPNSSPNAMRYTSALANSQAANDWFFTPALTTTANTRYQVAFRYRGEGIAGSASNYIEQLEVKAGPTPTAAGQTTTLYTNTNITNTAYTLANEASTPVVAVFTPGAGTQYVGFHAISAASQGNLYIDDLTITAYTVTATTSAALLQAVTVFPNPSTTGVFDLEIHGANAKSGLSVQVTNVLGQTVYTGTARDNFTNPLNLSSLAPGLYHLQVRNGAETMTRQLAIVK